MKKIFTIKNIILGIVIVLLDLCVYIFLGIGMMDYDDTYDGSIENYNSLETMDTFQKSVFYRYKHLERYKYNSSNFYSLQIV